MGRLLSSVLASLALLPLSVHAQDIDLSERRGVQEMVLSVKFLDRVIDTYKHIADWEVAYRGMAPAAQAVHWNLPADTPIEQAVLRLAGTNTGYVRLVQFQDVEQVRIRSSARPFDTGGIFNINSSVKDLEGVFEDMRDHGFVGFADPTYYTLNGRDYGGAMLRGHDGVVINLITRVNGTYDDLPPFTKMSSVRNATQMVDDYDESMDFFQNKMGWYKSWEAYPTWPEDGSNNMSLPNNLLLDGTITESAAGFKFDEHADGGRIEIFNFQGAVGKDFSHRAHPPNLGILMYRVHVPDLDVYLAQITANGVELLRPVMDLPIALYGEVRSAIVEAPSGAWIELFEQQ